MDPVKALLADAKIHTQINQRPLVTLSYAQSLDGSIAVHRGTPTNISGPQSLMLTHRLRAAHDAILVGIGTILADNPQLTVRLVDGKSPQPIILDSHLRFPLDANLLQGECKPWIVTTEHNRQEKQIRLEAAGVRLLRFPANESGRVPLTPTLAHLATMNINSLMVEGGARVITAFLENKLVDQVVLTIAPIYMGGLHAFTSGVSEHHEERETHKISFQSLCDSQYERVGDDLVVWGKLSSET